MPVAIILGWEPSLLFLASVPVNHPGYSEYELAGALRGEPVELVKCETSDLYVPASAEIIIEGRISPDPKTFQMEGPFGEYPGFYGGVRQPRPTIRVECITYRDDPIFRGGLCGTGPGKIIESGYWTSLFFSAIIWKALEDAGVSNVVGVWANPSSTHTNIRFQIDKTYREHARQVVSAFLGMANLSVQCGKNIIVVDKTLQI